MAAPKQFKLANFGGEPHELGLFCIATIDWSEPAEGDANGNPLLPESDRKDAMYVIVRDHGNQNNRDVIKYVGMTTDTDTRFRLHHAWINLRKDNRTKLSVGTVRYSGKSSLWARRNLEPALNQIEHILIWTLWPTLVNVRSMYSLPLISGKNVAAARPWLIRREGHRFRGAMPREIVYPWMGIKPGRDRSANVKYAQAV